MDEWMETETREGLEGRRVRSGEGIEEVWWGNERTRRRERAGVMEGIVQEVVERS